MNHMIDVEVRVNSACSSLHKWFSIFILSISFLVLKHINISEDMYRDTLLAVYFVISCFCLSVNTFANEYIHFILLENV